MINGVYLLTDCPFSFATFKMGILINSKLKIPPKKANS